MPFNQRQRRLGGQFYFNTGTVSWFSGLALELSVLHDGLASPKPLFTGEPEYHDISSAAVQSSSTLNPSLSPHLQIPKLRCDIYRNNANWWTFGDYTRGGATANLILFSGSMVILCIRWRSVLGLGRSEWVRLGRLDA
ncbi:hypothetical protein D9758_015460 [Tetrapyrgos nigripes]|uniref:Uncharacterized protein n=1 Tax=Tetrapyrgos nigripes TaxID=182062 RepID=A0A8H5CMB0_9AGAR|nr:hypothetical protein D9758_015460 [Tetrapyrgos nigripes]